MAAEQETSFPYISEPPFCLIVEGQKLWVPKDTFAALSPALDALVNQQGFKEATAGEAELTGKKYSEVLEWLKCTIPSPGTKAISGNLLT